MTNDRRTQICFFTFLMTLAVCFGRVFPAHSQDNETLYIETDYMKVNRANQVEYLKLEKEIWKPIHQERVNAGHILGWYLYRVSYPGGTEVHHNYTTVTVYRTFKDMENPYPQEIWTKVHPNLSCPSGRRGWQAGDEAVGLQREDVKELVETVISDS